MDGSSQEKVWGRTRLVINSDKFQRHQLEVNANTFCSVHFHRHRANRFIVCDGRIAVVEFYGWTHVVHELTADMTLDIPSLVVHQFVVLETGAVIEEYWSDRDDSPVENSDIIRLNTGGVMLPNETLEELLKRECDEHVA